jgi:hypothetical protein
MMNPSPTSSECTAQIEPFQIIEYDCRSKEECGGPTQLKIVQWNIERGYQLDQVIQSLLSLKPDIVCLQELVSPTHYFLPLARVAMTLSPFDQPITDLLKMDHSGCSMCRWAPQSRILDVLDQDIEIVR